MAKVWKRITLIGLVLALVAGIAAFAVACNGDKDPGEEHIDENYDGVCDICGASVELPIATYTITVQRSSGDPLTDVAVALTDENGDIIKDADNKNCIAYTGGGNSSAFAAGKVQFKVRRGEYNVELDRIPNGYQLEELTTTTTTTEYTMTLSASLMENMLPNQVTLTHGDVMYNYQFEDIRSGQTYTFSQLLQSKKAIILNFWYTTCTWCMTEFPDMQRVYEEFSDDIAIVALNTYAGDSQAATESFVTTHTELTFMMAKEIIPAGVNRLTMFNRFRVNGSPLTGYPTTVAIDREGVVTYIHQGAMSINEFRELFTQLSADDYKQDIVFPGEENLQDTPNISPVSSEEIERAVNNTDSGFDFAYRNEENEMNWPWIVGQDAKGSYIYPSNSFHRNSYSILYCDLEADVGQTIAFDFESETEAIYDELAVFINGEVVKTISGTGSGTCNVYVPLYAGAYELALAYVKDYGTDEGADTVKVRNMRFVDIDDAGENVEIKYRAANGEIIDNMKYEHYIDPVFNPTDGYYHVDSEDGPLLLADLANNTAWNQNSVVSVLSDIPAGSQQLNALIQYCQYANNSSIYGLVAVTSELKELLVWLVDRYKQEGNDNDLEWLELCKFIKRYNVPAGDPQNLGDPAAGLASYNAFKVQLNVGTGNESLEELEENPVVKNHVVKDRVIVPRGIWYEFTVPKTAVYRIRSVSFVDENGKKQSYDTYAWLRDSEGNVIAESDDVDFIPDDLEGSDGNFSMTRLMREGEVYYICCDLFAVQELGEYDFIVTELAVQGNFWTQAAAGEYTYDSFSDDGLPMGEPKVKDAVAYALGNDGVYRAADANGDPIEDSVIYVNIDASSTSMFPNMKISQMLGITVYFCNHCHYADDEWSDNGACPICGSSDVQQHSAFDLPTLKRDENGKVMYKTFQRVNSTETYFIVEYETDEDGNVIFTDYTDIMRGYVAAAQTQYPSDDFDGPHRGFVKADEQLVNILMTFIAFGDYSVQPDLDEAWLMLAFYYLHLGY